MPTRRHLIPAVAALVVLAVPAAAQAGLPSTSTDLIKLGRSIGAVDLGESVTTAKLGWGRSAAKCTGNGVNGTCQYAERTPSRGSAIFYVVDRKVTSVTISLGTVGGKYVFTTPLVEFRTAKGIGLGSSFASVKRAYPQAKRYGTTFSVLGPGKAYTSFSTDGKRVTALTVGDGLHQS